MACCCNSNVDSNVINCGAIRDRYGASFANDDVLSVDQGDAISLSAVLNISAGRIVLSDDADAITLAKGWYRVSYGVSADAADTGDLEVALTLDGDTVSGSAAVYTQTVADSYGNMSRQVMIKVDSDTAVLRLVNNGSITTNYTDISVVITPIRINNCTDILSIE